MYLITNQFSKQITLSKTPHSGFCGIFLRISFPLILAFISIICQPLFAQQEEDAENNKSDKISGYASLRYKAQKQENNRSDQDMIEYASVTIGDTARDKITWHFSGSMREDLDGSNIDSFPKERFTRLIFPNTPIEDNPIISSRPFFTVDDAIDDGFTARPYEFYSDVKDVLFVENVRAGRQYIREIENFHLDGAKLQFKDVWGLRFTTFAGKPVHFFETSGSGDFMGGGSVEYKPLKNAKVQLDYSYVNDNNDDTGGNNDNLFAFHYRHHLTNRLNIFADYSMIGATARDAEFRTTLLIPEVDMDVNIYVFKQLSTLENFTVEFDSFNSITGDYFPYTDYSVNVYKGLWDWFGVSLGFNIRDLNEKSNEGMFNHEFDNYFITASSHDFPFKGGSISITGNLNNTDDDETRSFGFDIRQKFGKKLTASGGSYYTLFKFDAFSMHERDHVRTYFINAKYKITKNIQFTADYEFERSNQDSYHTVETSLKYSF